MLDQVTVFAANVDPAALGADGAGGNQAALDQPERIVLQNDAVLAGARLGLVGVDHDILRLGRLAIDETPLHPGREARAAASTQVRSLHLVDDLVGRHRQGLAEAGEALVREKRLEGRGVVQAKSAAQQDRFQRVRLVQQILHAVSLIASSWLLTAAGPPGANRRSTGRTARASCGGETHIHPESREPMNRRRCIRLLPVKTGHPR